jgi:hypothetical protein
MLAASWLTGSANRIWHTFFGVKYPAENCGAKSLACETQTFQYGISWLPAKEAISERSDILQTTVTNYFDNFSC